jgi:hypothetical protein
VGLARQPDGIFQDIAKKNFERRQRRRARQVCAAPPVAPVGGVVAEVPAEVR